MGQSSYSDKRLIQRGGAVLSLPVRLPAFWRQKGFWKLAGVAVLVLSTGGPAVFAESDDGGSRRFWLLERQRTQPKFIEQPLVRPPTHLSRRPVGRRDASVADPSRAQDIAAQQPDSHVEPRFFVAVIGDSLAQMLAQGLQDQFADTPEVQVLRKGRESSGLVRDDFYDWPKAVRDLLASSEHVTFAVMMIGSNDRQPLKDAEGSYDPLTPKWREIYTKRVEDMAQQFHDKQIPLTWVGLPIMRNDRLSSDMSVFNEIYRAAAEKFGQTYVDTWEAFVDDNGQYDAYGPDMSGQIVKLRAGDGVHFTRAGALKLAHFAEHDIRHAVEEAKGADAPTADAGTAKTEVPLSPTGVIDINEQIRRQVLGGGRRNGDVQAGLPIPALPADIYFPSKPAAGPILSLTGTIISPGGQLAVREKNKAASASETQAILDRAFVQGRPSEAKPGRADDFSWPRR
jgi:uncharacterized protein